MALSNLSSWDGLLIHNLNPIYDPATYIGNGSDWTLKMYYQGSSDGDAQLFFIGNDFNKYFGVMSLNGTAELQIYFNNISGITSGVTRINTGIFAYGSPKSYTFVKEGNSFSIYQGDTSTSSLGVNGFIFTNANLFSDFNVVSNVPYMSIGGRNNGSYQYTITNFINFWTIPLSINFINGYYNLIYTNDGPDLICNIRADSDYTSKNLIVERDVNNSIIQLLDVCGVGYEGP